MNVTLIRIPFSSLPTFYHRKTQIDNKFASLEIFTQLSIGIAYILLVKASKKIKFGWNWNQFSTFSYGAWKGWHNNLLWYQLDVSRVTKVGNDEA